MDGWRTPKRFRERVPPPVAPIRRKSFAATRREVKPSLVLNVDVPTIDVMPSDVPLTSNEVAAFSPQSLTTINPPPPPSPASDPELAGIVEHLGQIDDSHVNLHAEEKLSPEHSLLNPDGPLLLEESQSSSSEDSQSEDHAEAVEEQLYKCPRCGYEYDGNAQCQCYQCIESDED